MAERLGLIRQKEIGKPAFTTQKQRPKPTATASQFKDRLSGDTGTAAMAARAVFFGVGISTGMTNPSKAYGASRSRIAPKRAAVD